MRYCILKGVRIQCAYFCSFIVSLMTFCRVQGSRVVLVITLKQKDGCLVSGCYLNHVVAKQREVSNQPHLHQAKPYSSISLSITKSRLVMFVASLLFGANFIAFFFSFESFHNPHITSRMCTAFECKLTAWSHFESFWKCCSLYNIRWNALLGCFTDCGYVEIPINASLPTCLSL